MIFIVGLSTGEETAADGKYLESYTPDVDPLGRGVVKSTGDFRKAKKFATREEAFEFWKQQSKRTPKRPDGKPNRPLTAFTVSVVPYGTKPI